MDYSKKMKAPIYEITGEKPKLEKLVDSSKTDELLAKIEDAEIPQGIKTFLKIGATRHYRFDYRAIAEFYAHSSPEVQELFEDSGLVIIDFDQAIENGFVQMNKRLMEIRANEPKNK